MKVLEDYEKLRTMLEQQRKEVLDMISEVRGTSSEEIRISERIMRHSIKIGQAIEDIDHDVERINNEIMRTARR